MRKVFLLFVIVFFSSIALGQSNLIQVAEAVIYPGEVDFPLTFENVPAEGNMIIAIIGGRAGGETTITPADPDAGWTVLDPAIAQGRLWAFYKIAGPDEPLTHMFNHGNSRYFGTLMEFSDITMISQTVVSTETSSVEAFSVGPIDALEGQIAIAAFSGRALEDYESINWGAPFELINRQQAKDAHTVSGSIGQYKVAEDGPVNASATWTGSAQPSGVLFLLTPEEPAIIIADEVLFFDDFNQNIGDAIGTSGYPAVDYTIWTTVDPLEPGGGTALIEEYAPGDGMIKLLARESSSLQSGNRTEVSAPLASIRPEFNPVLHSNTDILEWVFTAKQNRNSPGGTNGFNGTQTGMAVVLASDSSMWGSQQDSNAKGYAITFLKPEGNMYCVSLSRFDGGLSNYTVIAGNKAEDVFSEFRTWVTVRVTYNPVTNEWKLYFRDEESQTTKGDISDFEGMRLIEAVVDDSFTDIEMTHFGYALNTPAPGAAGAGGNAFWVDDFKLSLGLPYPGPQGIFVDDFNQDTVNPIVSSGDPTVDYTIWTTVDPPSEDGGTALIEEYAPGDGILKLLARHSASDQTGNRTEVSAPLSAYNEPFNPVLSFNEDTLVWVFTAKQNRNSAGGGTGFDGTQTGLAVVLASDSSMWGSQQGSTAKGYAITFLKPEGNMYCVSLSRFDGGLSNYTVIAGNKAEDVFSEFRTWVTVKVTYIPGTNEWSLFFRDEQSQTTKGDVYYSGDMKLVETAVDDTFTDLEMTHFGFALNTPAPGAAGAGGNAFWVDDFLVSLGSLEAPLVTLNTSVIGTGGQIIRSPDQDNYAVGSEVELTAIPDEGYEFEGWSGDVTSTDNPLTITLETDMDISANFTPVTYYTLTIIYDDEMGVVSKSPAGIENQTEFRKGTVFSLTANPLPGFSFDGWSGDATGTDNPLTVILDSNKEITASFSPITYYTLKVSYQHGVVTQTPIGTSFEENTEIRLTAIAFPGYEFSGWSGDAEGTENPLTVTMDSNKDITANFTPIIKYFTLNITSEHGVVEQSVPGTEFAENTEIVLTAIPHEEYGFVSWSGDVTSTDNPLTVTIKSNMNITANYTVVTSISQEPDMAITVMPNPSYGLFSVQVMQPVSYKVYNLNGVLVKEGSASETFSLDMRGYNNAIYILQVESQDGVSIKRIMKISE